MLSCVRALTVIVALPSLAQAQPASAPDLESDVASGLTRIFGNSLAASRSYLPSSWYYYAPISVNDVGSSVASAARILGPRPSREGFSVARIDCQVSSPAGVKAELLRGIRAKHGAPTARALYRYMLGVTPTELGALFDRALAAHPGRGMVSVNRGTHIANTADTEGMMAAVATSLARRFVQSQPAPQPARAPQGWLSTLERRWARRSAK